MSQKCTKNITVRSCNDTHPVRLFRIRTIGTGALRIQAHLQIEQRANLNMAITAHFARNDLVSMWHERKIALLQASQNQVVQTGHARIGRAALIGDPVLFWMKRVIDLIGAICALLFLAPLLVAIAIAIKVTSPGPVLFSQYRYGYRNKRFRIFKFRTMHTHLTDFTGTRQTTRQDSRITSIGQILRTTSLDELPQLLNVLKGEMSLVGPRPHVPGMLAGGLLYEELVPYYFQRHTVRPGITGLAQVNGCRGETVQARDAIARIDYDLEYIEEWSPWIDIKIIAKTCKREFLSGHGV
jgi:polysaccharide biosynthesis protein PslA